jgi:D-3-phosphoglycerate dehydrogenase / 2-oxoglutarate reductase
MRSREASQVVVTGPGFDASDEQSAGLLASSGVSVIDLGPSPDPGQFATALTTAAGAIVGAQPITAPMLARCPSLRVLARTGVGIDSIDLGAATEQGVLVTTTPGVNDAVVAEHTIALILAAVRQLVAHNEKIRSGGWDAARQDIPETLSGSTLGVIGYGRIGRRVARLASAMGADVLVSDPYQPDCVAFPHRPRRTKARSSRRNSRECLQR